MRFSTVHKALDPKTKALFIKWVTAKGHGNQYNMMFGKNNVVSLYKDYICVDAPNKKGFSSELVKKMRARELVAQHDISTEQGKHPDAITQREYAENIFIQGVMKEALKECDDTLSALYAEFIESKVFKDSIRKSIDGAKMAKDLGLPKSVETELVDGAVASATGNTAAAKKAVQSIVKKQGNDLPKQFGNVKKLADAIEANIKKFGYQPVKLK